MRERAGVYPGTFNPLTVAHLAIAQAALRQRRLSRVVFALSRSPINKEHVDRPRFADRLAIIVAEAATKPWMAVETTDARLLVDIADDYDVLIMGADKWAQVIDPQYYGGHDTRRDAALAALPELAIAPRPPFPVPDQHALVVDTAFSDISSSAVRAGARSWMSPAAAAFDELTGAWSDPARYDRWLVSGQET